MDKAIVLDKLGQFKKQYGRQYGIEALGLFGSCARGEARQSSDVDIVITTKTPDPYIIVHIKERLEQNLNCAVDIVRMREKMSQGLREQIEKDVVYVS
jgi:predicted nucleotidyltransferase